MSTESELRHRLNDVSVFLSSLRALEKRHSSQRRVSVRWVRVLAASRASSFIMMYNCVEYATKRALKEIRTEAAEKVDSFEELAQYWQTDIVRTRFGARLASGTNFDVLIENIRSSIPPKPSWLKNPSSVESLPFGGNINHERLIKLAHDIGDRNWKPPRSSLGGSDLELVRRTRNELAHGDEQFEVIGSQYSVKDIRDKLNRVRLFMCSYVRMLDRHRLNAEYRIG